MINILIVEDDSVKCEKLIDSLTKISGVNRDCITTAADVISAKKYLLSSYFDLLLLDIQLPPRHGEVPRSEAGLRLLEELHGPLHYKLPHHIIGITSYEDIQQRVSQSFAEKLVAIIKYEPDSNDWRVQLENRVGYLVSSKQELSITGRRGYDYDVGIVCAVDDLELEAVITHCGVSGEPISAPNDQTSYYSFNLEGKSGSLRAVAASTREMGMTAAATLATKIIYQFTPRYLVMTGITAGLKTRTNFGDVILADPTWNYDSGKHMGATDGSEFLPEPSQVRVDPDVVDHFRQLKRDSQALAGIKSRWVGDRPSSDITIHIGPLASGAAVVADSKVLSDIIKQQRQLLGIDMEAYALCFAGENAIKPKPKYFVVKSVSDFADAEKSDKYRKYAAYVSVEVVKQYFKRFAE